MGYGTKIEWAHHTFNPWIGCTKISPACDHCYAAEWDRRHYGGRHWGAGVERHRTSASTWQQPRRWARKARETGERPRVFCCSLADVFDNEVPAEWRHDLWRLILDTPELDWLLLTKRIGNVYAMVQNAMWANGFHPDMNHSLPSNVWLGITVVTQAEANRDVPKLLEAPAAVRFLSCEPLLESIDLTSIDLLDKWRSAHDSDILCHLNALTGVVAGPDDVIPKVDWVIAGGESGTHARPMHPAWARGLRDQCVAAGAPFFFKQWGEWLPGSQMSEADREHYAEVLSLDQVHIFDVNDNNSGNMMARVGKKAAGRLLDGREHNEVPSPNGG